MFQGFLFSPKRREFKRIPASMSKNEYAVAGEQARQARIIQKLLSWRGRAVTDVLLSIRWIGQDEIETFATFSQMTQGGEHVLHADLDLSF